MMDFVFIMMDFVFIMITSEGGDDSDELSDSSDDDTCVEYIQPKKDDGITGEESGSDDDGDSEVMNIPFKMDEFCIKNDEFCI